MYDVAWKNNDEFWVSGPATHSEGDTANLADVGPRGATLMTLDATGAITGWKHYVRASNDAKDVGLPSSDVRDVVTSSDGSAYLVCARERMRPVSDRIEGAPFELSGQQRAGGIALVDATGALGTIVTDGLGDPRAAALQSDKSCSFSTPKRACSS